MRKVYFFFIFLFLTLFILTTLCFSDIEIDIDAPYMVYDWKNEIIEASDKFTLSYLGYTLSGESLFMDITEGYGKIIGAKYVEDKDSYYTGNIYFKKGFFELNNGKFYKDNTLQIGAKKIAIYPNHFVSFYNLTLYDNSGGVIFGLPYYGKLLLYPEYEIFPKISISSSYVKVSSYLNYYNNPSSFGTFLISYDTRYGASIRWEHFLKEDFSIFYDHNFGDNFYGVYFKAPVSVRLSSNLDIKVSYSGFKDSIFKELYISYNYREYGKTLIGSKLLFTIKGVELYSDTEYSVMDNCFYSFKIGFSPRISPFKIDLGYDFVKKEGTLWFHLDI